MKIAFKKIRGVLIPLTDDDEQKLASFDDGAVYEVDIKNMDIRTLKQNAALHKYFTILAEVLNASGQYLPKVIRIDIPWSMELVKEILWKGVQQKMLGKRSTTKLTKEEVTKVYDVLNRALGERCGVSVEFPSRDE